MTPYRGSPQLRSAALPWRFRHWGCLSLRFSAFACQILRTAAFAVRGPSLENSPWGMPVLTIYRFCLPNTASRRLCGPRPFPGEFAVGDAIYRFCLPNTADRKGGGPRYGLMGELSKLRGRAREANSRFLPLFADTSPVEEVKLSAPGIVIATTGSQFFRHFRHFKACLPFKTRFS
jgi:hypothetical protein